MLVERFIRVRSLSLPAYDKPLTCFACVVYRPMQDAHEAATRERGHLLHPARAVSKDPSGRSFLLLIFRYLRVTGLNPLPLVSHVSHAHGAYAAAAGGRGACTPSSIVCSDRRNAHPVSTTCHCLCSNSLYQIARDSYVPIVRDSYTAAAGVRFTSTHCRNCRPYKLCGSTISFHTLWLVDCEGLGRCSASVVCIDSARCLCSRCCRVMGLYRLERRLYRHLRRSRSVHNYSLFECKRPGPFPAISSLTITEGPNAATGSSRCTSIACTVCRL